MHLIKNKNIYTKTSIIDSIMRGITTFEPSTNVCEYV